MCPKLERCANINTAGECLLMINCQCLHLLYIVYRMKKYSLCDEKNCSIKQCSGAALKRTRQSELEGSQHRSGLSTFINLDHFICHRLWTYVDHHLWTFSHQSYLSILCPAPIITVKKKLAATFSSVWRWSHPLALLAYVAYLAFPAYLLHTWEKPEFLEIKSPPIFWIFRQILGWERNFRQF